MESTHPAKNGIFTTITDFFKNLKPLEVVLGALFISGLFILALGKEYYYYSLFVMIQSVTITIILLLHKSQLTPDSNLITYQLIGLLSILVILIYSAFNNPTLVNTSDPFYIIFKYILVVIIASQTVYNYYMAYRKSEQKSFFKNISNIKVILPTVILLTVLSVENIFFKMKPKASDK